MAVLVQWRRSSPFAWARLGTYPGDRIVANRKRHRVSLFLIAICAMVMPLIATPALQSSAQEASPVAVTGSGYVSLWTEFTAGGEASGVDELVNTWNGMGNGITINHRPI